MLGVLFFVYIIMVALGLYFHKVYEGKPANSNRYINLSQFYIDIMIPFFFGSFAFLIILEIIKNPEIPLFMSDKALFFVLALTAALCFFGSGMHITCKLTSRLIEENHKAYKLNRFYHIYAAHMTGYGGFMFFIMALSILGLKHPQEEIAQNMQVLYILGGMMLGFFVSKVTSKPREMIKVLWPVNTIFIFSYLMLVYPYWNLIVRSPISLFLTSIFATALVLYIKTLLPILLARIRKRHTTDLGF